MKGRLSAWGLACVLISLAFSGGPAHAAAVLGVGFVGPCSLSGPITYPTLPLSDGTTRSFTCWAGSTVPASLSGTPTYFAVAQQDAPTKVYVEGTSKNGTGTCTVNAEGRGLCTGGMTMTGTMSRSVVGGPWCLNNTGTFTASVPPLTTSITGGWLVVGDTLVITGTIDHHQQHGPFAALAHLDPNIVAGASCVDGATNFVIAGLGGGVKVGNGIPPFDTK